MLDMSSSTETRQDKSDTPESLMRPTNKDKSRREKKIVVENKNKKWRQNDGKGNAFWHMKFWRVKEGKEEEMVTREEYREREREREGRIIPSNKG